METSYTISTTSPQEPIPHSKKTGINDDTPLLFKVKIEKNI
jgi:hypothetical protein